MKKFYLYIICTMIVVFVEKKYELNGFLLFSFFSISIFFFENLKSLFNFPFSKKQTMLVVYVLLFIICFSFFFNLLPSLVLKKNNIQEISNYSTFGFLKVLIIFPILEELVFRGGLLSLLLKKISSKKAIFISALGFSITHYLSDSGLLAVFILGVLLAHLYIKTKNIYFCIIAHILTNFFVIVLVPFLASIMKIKEIPTQLMVLIIAGLIIIFSSFKIYRYDKN